MQLKVKKLHAGATLPRFATEGAACFDLHAFIPGDAMAKVRYADQKNIGTGLSFEIPAGYVMLIFSRSGHGFRENVRLSNCVGVIDSDYRGEVRVKLARDVEYKLGVDPAFEVKTGDRIAQAMILPLPHVQMIEVDELGSTARGAGGFGSTGQ